MVYPTWLRELWCLLRNLGALVAFSNDAHAAKLCYNNIRQFLTGETCIIATVRCVAFLEEPLYYFSCYLVFTRLYNCMNYTV